MKMEIKRFRHGETLQLIRESRGMTQFELSKETGISQSNISKMEKNVYPITNEYAEKICNVLLYLPAILEEKIIQTRLFDKKGNRIFNKEGK